MGRYAPKEAVKVERDLDGKVLQKWDASCFLSSRGAFLDLKILLLKVVSHGPLVFSPLLPLWVQERWGRQA